VPKSSSAQPTRGGMRFIMLLSMLQSHGSVLKGFDNGEVKLLNTNPQL